MSNQSASNYIPGITGVHHVGFTVPEINKAVHFFTDVLGCQEVVRFGPFKDDTGTSMKDLFNLDPRTIIKTIVLMRCGNGANIELFEYEAEVQKKEMPLNSDLGGYHIGFYVVDIFKALEKAKALGVKTFMGPLEVNEGSVAGMKVVYIMSPWGTQLELMSYPNGVEYEKTSPIKLWTPE